MKGAYSGVAGASNNTVEASPAGTCSDVMLGVRSIKTACSGERYRGYFNIAAGGMGKDSSHGR